LKEQKGIKIYQTLVLTFIETKDNKPEIRMVYFNSTTATIINDNQINEVIQLSIQQIKIRINVFLMKTNKNFQFIYQKRKV